MTYFPDICPQKSCFLIIDFISSFRTLMVVFSAGEYQLWCVHEFDLARLSDWADKTIGSKAEGLRLSGFGSIEQLTLSA